MTLEARVSVASSRAAPRIAVLSPRQIRNVLNAETEALVDALAHYPVETVVFDTWAMPRAGISEMLRERFDAAYAVVGSQLVEGPERSQTAMPMPASGSPSSTGWPGMTACWSSAGMRFAPAEPDSGTPGGWVIWSMRMS